MSLTIIKKEISLNVGQPNNFELIHAMQGDNNSIEITATLYNLNELYEINTDDIKIKGVNALDERIYKDISEHTDHTVTFQLTDDMLISDGLLKLVIVFTEKYKQLTTFPFVIRVFNAPGDTTLEDAVSVSALVEAAENWALLCQSYTIGTDNEIREGDSTDNAKYYYEKSNLSANNAKQSEDNAKTSEINSKTSETNAAQSAKTANESSEISIEKSSDAQNYANQAKSYTVGNTGFRENENIDNAKYYYEQNKSIAESLSGVLRPMGTVTFANLPTLSSASQGDMYNISDQFTTNSDFAEGDGYIIPAGSNVYKTADGKWDVLAGSPVTGIKGNTETTYRKGNVNITKENIGLGNVDNTSDSDKPISTAQQTALDGKVNKSGDTMTDNLRVTRSNGDKVSGFEVYRSDTDRTIILGVGNGGLNRGIWDPQTAKWLVYEDENDNVILNGSADTVDGRHADGIFGNYGLATAGGFSPNTRGCWSVNLTETPWSWLNVVQFDQGHFITQFGSTVGNPTTVIVRSRYTANNFSGWDDGWKNVSDGGTSYYLARGGDRAAMTFNWSGQNGQPSWLWGGNDGQNMYVYNPSNFSVNKAKKVIDAYNGNDVTFAYGNNELEYDSFTWLAGWNGYELRAVNKNLFQRNLGFAPVQQGGGSGQYGNKVYIGWSGSALKAQVDGVDLGDIVTAHSGTNADLLVDRPLNCNLANGALMRKTYIGWSDGWFIDYDSNTSITINNKKHDGNLGGGIRFVTYSHVESYMHPIRDGIMRLGSSNERWNQIYSTNSSISTSDRREKKDISYIGENSVYDTAMADEQLEKLIMGIKPVVFKRKNGESGRPHHGLISQDFEELLEEIGLTDHAGFIKSPKTIDVEKEVEVEKEITNDDGEKEIVIEKQKVLKQKEIEGEYTYGFRYEELITDLVRFCQIQEHKRNALEDRVDKLEKTLETLLLQRKLIP